MTASRPGTAGILQIKDGYFWDPAQQNYFIPRGFGYQTFNPPVGADQSLEQLAYDFTEFKKLYANSSRVEMVWNQVERAQGVFDWSKADFMVDKADELGMKLFVLIGYQYAPGWFPGSWTATNDVGGGSVVVNYEHPNARAAYSNYVYQVSLRYKDRAAIGAWILGNEYAYFDLWNTNRSFLGYDPISQASFRSWLSSIYTNNIAALNANWKSAYTSFNAVIMATNYPSDRNNPGYYDLIQWRKKSIADYVAIGAMAARKADPNHLLTYSMVGGSFVAFDALNTCEDAKTIVARCAQAGAPLSFWSINNYASTATGSEMRAADFGICKHRAQSGLPVLVTETGHSSTDDLNPEEPQRYSQALPTQLWEALISGAMGVHIFTWNDRDMFAGPFIREKGFGIVNQNRTPKEPVYTNIANTFRRMANLDLPALLGASMDPRPEIQFLWTRYGDVVWPRANFENAQVWGALERLGYQCGIIDEDQFEAGAGTNSPALLLSRCMMMDPADLDQIATNLIFSGVNVHANADLPGQYTAYHALNPNWASRMNSLFGLNVGVAVTGMDSGVVGVTFGALYFSGMGNLGDFTPAYSDQIASWKIWHGIPINSGTVVSHTGLNGSQSAIPALQVKNLGAAKTAINTFGLGDVENAGALPQEHTWDFRYQWLRAIYHDWFGIQPQIELSGPGAGYVYSDYRVCRNGSVLIGLLNGAKNAASVALSATNLLAGKTVENLTSGGIVELSSDGVVNLNMNGDDYALLYAYSAGGVDVSLLNSNPNKLWISNAPAVVGPTGSNFILSVGYDLRDANLSLVASFERVLSPNLVFAQATNGLLVSGRGTAAIPLRIPDADYNNPWYVSSRAGGEYVLHARLLKSGADISDTFIPVRLVWAVHPVSLPATVAPGGTCQVVLEWEELPAFLSSEGSGLLDRARLWQPWLASQQYYKVVLELRSNGQLVSAQEAVVNTGSGQQTFTVVVPQNATGPFTWTAYLQTVPNASVDMVDSFEDRDTGEGTNTYLPWVMLTYPEGVPIYQNSGVAPSETLPGGTASDGKQALFMVLTNPPNPQGFSGSFIYYSYPQPWALPRDFSQWSNYWFSFDFRETNGLDCVMEMQVKDVHGGLMNFTKRYNPSPGWDRAQATLDQFTVPSWAGRFDPEAVAQLIVNVQLLKTNVQYLGYLDNIRFVGPKTLEQTTAQQDLWDSFDNRDAATGNVAGKAALVPWYAYVYPDSQSRILNQGIVLNQGLNGGQVAFMGVTNPASIGPISTLGIYQSFPGTWALPADTNEWKNYGLSYWFREANGRSCRVEMQVKSAANNWIEFGRAYNPGQNGWDYVSASLDRFVQPTGIGLFDRTQVQGIALNIRLLQTGANYVAFFDNIFFESPESIVPSGAPFGIYDSSNDSAPDATTFVIDQIGAGAHGEIILSWLARSNRLYSLEFQESSLISLEYFQPVPGQSGLNRLTDGVLTATDTNAPFSATRFYRVRAQPR